MKSEVFHPDPALRPYIQHYWLISGTQEVPEAIQLLPDGGVSLLLNLGEGLHSSRFGAHRSEGAMIVGAMTHGDSQVLLGESLLFGITFKPAGFARFHRFDPLDGIANHVLPFDRSLLPGPDGLLRRSAAQVDRFYLDRLSHPRYSLVPVLEDIVRHKGQVRMDELMKRHCTTARQLERQFKHQVGITPKEYIDLTRFNHAFGIVARHGGERSLMDIAWECGYYDHAHMANAFRKHLGRPPAEFILSDSSKIALAGA